MNLKTKAARLPNVAVFSRNHRHYLEEAACIGAENPECLITFRASKAWISAKVALERFGPREVYFVPIGAGTLVEYEAKLERVLLFPKQGTRETEEMLKYCPPSTRNEGLWEKFGEKVNTLYAISHCYKPASPFPFTALSKVSDDTRIDRNYGYSYALVYRYCRRCAESPCRCAKT